MRFSRTFDDVLRNRSHLSILRAMEELPEGFQVPAREAARRASVSHTTASFVLQHLSELGVVHVRRTILSDFYELNRSHAATPQLVELFEWERGALDGLKTFLRQQLRRRAKSVSAAYLFGSAVRGDMREDSDIDLAVICPPDREEQIQEAMAELDEAVRMRYGNRLNTIIGTAPLERMSRGRTGRARLWKRVADGEPILELARRRKSVAATG